MLERDITHLPSPGPSTLTPTVRISVLSISIWISLKSPELVRVKSRKGMRTSVHSCGASSEAGTGSQSRCWKRSERTVNSKVTNG